MSQTVVLKVKGLHSFPNQLGEIPTGGLIQADNVIINRDGVIEPRRGFAIYGNAMGSTSTNFARQLIVYKNRILRHFGANGGTTLEFDDGNENFVPFEGTVSEAEEGVRIKAVESNGNLFFTSSSGIKKISALDSNMLPTAKITDAGGVKGLDTELFLNEQLGFLTQDSKVAYRIVWGIKDANNNVILGTPSERSVISNSILDLLTNDFNRLLDEIDTAAAVDPSDDLHDTDYFDLYSIPYGSSAAVLKNNMSSVCTKLDLDLGGTKFAEVKTTIDELNLSLAPTTAQLLSLQECFDEIIEILNILIDAEDSPKISPDVSLFIGSTQSSTVELRITVPDSITTAHFYQIYRTAVASSVAGTSLSDIDPGLEFGLVYEDNPTQEEIDEGVIEIHDITPEDFRGANLYTNPNSGEGIAQANEVPPMAKDIALYKNYLFFANTQTKYRRRLSLLSVSSFEADVSTFTISDGTTTNTYTFAEEENIEEKKIKISTLDTPGQQVDETARSLVRVINRNDDEIVYAYYLSGPTDVPGLILFESRTLGGNAFHFNVGDSEAYGDQFNPKLPDTGNSVIADNEIAPNRIFHSKANQPEAVPLVNYFDVGPKDKKIQRILALRDSLFVLKEEGIYRVSGDSAPFVVTLFDNSAVVTAPDTAVVINNQIHVLTDQGVAQISDNGVTIISRPIEGELIKLNNPMFAAFKTASFGCAYESDRNYYLWTVTDPTDTKATQCFRYNSFTDAWYKSTMSKTCAIVNPADDKMYLGAADVNFIEKERKNFDRTDYSDREYELIVAPGVIDENVIELPSVTNVEERDVIFQKQYLTIFQFNRLLMKLDTDSGVNDEDYFSTLEAVAGDDLRNKVTLLASKLDNDSGVDNEDYSEIISGYGNSFVDTQSAFNDIVEKLVLDPGVLSSNFIKSHGAVSYEVVITNVDRKNLKVTTEYAYPFISGPVTVYKHINCVVKYAPQTFGDPSTLKQVSESTIMFERTSFSKCELGFSTDLNPSYVSHSFTGSGNGIFGSGVFGENIFGGSGNATPFRTLVPREKQRCRFINVEFKHGTAREYFAVFGISLTVVPTSSRAYK